MEHLIAFFTGIPPALIIGFSLMGGVFFKACCSFKEVSHMEEEFTHDG